MEKDKDKETKNPIPSIVASRLTDIEKDKVSRIEGTIQYLENGESRITIVIDGYLDRLL